MYLNELFQSYFQFFAFSFFLKLSFFRNKCDKGAYNTWLLNLSPLDHTVSFCKPGKLANMPHITQGRMGKTKWIYEQLIKTQHEFSFSFSNIIDFIAISIILSFSQTVIPSCSFSVSL